MTGVPGMTPKRSLFKLIGDLPSLLVELLRSELEQLKQELTEKIKHAGVGVGLLAGAAVFAFFAVSVLIAAAILGLAVVLQAWAAALIVGAALLIIAGILVAVGVTSLRKGMPPAPTETIKSLKKDVRAIKGIGKRANP
ncbi:MAG: phage holin family protein [Microbacteriaceae bacterium]|nr:phage holin family protein [Microbacteriaceae bacterium]